MSFSNFFYFGFFNRRSFFFKLFSLRAFVLFFNWIFLGSDLLFCCGLFMGNIFGLFSNHSVSEVGR